MLVRDRSSVPGSVRGAGSHDRTDRRAVRTDEAFALELDAADPLPRTASAVPPARRAGRRAARSTSPGHSLGAQPKTVGAAVEAELEAWARLGVEGHFHEGATWVVVRRAAARADGPAGRRATGRGRDDEHADRQPAPAARVVLPARAGSDEAPHRRADVPVRPLRGRVAAASTTGWIRRAPHRRRAARRARRSSGPRTSRPPSTSAGDRLAVALLAGVNYATGQVHDIARLTAAVHAAGALAGWQLAHSAGQRAAGAARLGRRLRDVVHLQVPERRAGLDRPDLRQRPPRLGSVASRACPAGSATRWRRGSGWPRRSTRSSAPTAGGCPTRRSWPSPRSVPRSPSSTRWACRPCVPRRSS